MKKFIIYKYSKNTQEIDKKITKNIDIMLNLYKYRFWSMYKLSIFSSNLYII